MDQNIRITVDEVYKGIYDRLKNIAFNEFHDFFFLCVCIGKKNDIRKDFIKKKIPCFRSNNITTDEWYTYYAIYTEDNKMDLSCLGDDEKVIEVMQEYANGGMEILIDELLCDYVKRDASGSYIVHHTEQLPKELLMSILDWSE